MIRFLSKAARARMVCATATASASTVHADVLGEIALPAGEFTFAVKPLDLGGVSLMRLRQL